MDWNQIYTKCMHIRAFEEAIEKVYLEDVVESPVHLSIGQELSSVLAGINKKDQITLLGTTAHTP